MFGDFEFQRIYREHGSMTLEEFDPEGRWPVCRLLVNCRNTPSVAGLACACVGVDPSYCRVLRDDDRPPEIHAWDDAQDQARLLARTLEELHDDGFAWDDIVVLSTVADVRSACASLRPGKSTLPDSYERKRTRLRLSSTIHWLTTIRLFLLTIEEAPNLG